MGLPMVISRIPWKTVISTTIVIANEVRQWMNSPKRNEVTGDVKQAAPDSRRNQRLDEIEQRCQDLGSLVGKLADQEIEHAKAMKTVAFRVNLLLLSSLVAVSAALVALIVVFVH